MCVTRPPTCATQLEMGSNSLLSTCTLPCMSAMTTPYAEDVTVEIEVATRRTCGLSARSCASLTGTTSKNGNCLHYKDLSEREIIMTIHGTYPWRKGGRRRRCRFGSGRGGKHQGRQDRADRAGNAALGAPNFPHPNATPPPARLGTHHSTLSIRYTLVLHYPWHSSVSASGLHP